MVADLDEALAHGTLAMWCSAVEGPVSFSIAEAAGMPLWAILIHVVCSVLVALPAIELGNAGAHLFLPLFDAVPFHAPNHVGTVAMTPPWFCVTVPRDRGSK